MDEYVYQQPYQVPSPAPRFPWKPVLGVLGAVVLVGGGAFIWRLRGASTRQQLVDRQQTVRAEIAKADGACVDSADRALCQKALLDIAAQSMNAPEACRVLKDPAALDDCVWGVAAKTGDTKICTQIGNTALAATCVDGVVLQKAVDASDETLCASVKDEAKRAACVESVAPTTAANCAARGKRAEECAARKTIDLAAVKRDPSLCGSIVTEFQDLCRELVVDDVDLDGLVAADETLYGSNPNKADTDGDGFMDGDEVKNGFNPAGPGKLVTTGS